MDKPTKIICVILACIGIAAIQAAVFSRFELPTKRLVCSVIFVLFASLILVYVICALSAGEVGVKTPTGGEVVSRQKDPGGYWLFLCIYTAIGLWMFYLIISADWRLFEKQAQNSQLVSKPAQIQTSK